MNAPALKNKTLVAWLAFIGGQLGLHRLYLYGWSDLWAWAHPVVAALGWHGVERVRVHGQDDQLAWLLVPLLGFTLAATALTAIYYGLMSPEKWNALHNPSTPDAAAGNTNWQQPDKGRVVADGGQKRKVALESKLGACRCTRHRFFSGLRSAIGLVQSRESDGGSGRRGLSQSHFRTLNVVCAKQIADLFCKLLEIITKLSVQKSALQNERNAQYR